jgi:Domain of Unknown Function (DUF1206)
VRDAQIAARPGANATSARRATQIAERSRPFQWLVRAGFVGRGITYGMIGALALALALGAGTMGAAPNQQGALSVIARSIVGRIALVAIAAGLLAYALWKFTQAIFGRGPEGGGGSSLKDRVSSFAGGIVYIGFFLVAVRVLTGTQGNSSSQPSHTAAGVLGWPGGQVLVGLGGAIMIAISVYQLYDALSGGFAEEEKTAEMGARERQLFMIAGRVGLVARALVFVLVGYFLLRTAIDFKAGNAVGVDGALLRLHHQPYGPWIVGLVAAGLITFGAFSLLEARYRRL